MFNAAPGGRGEARDCGAAGPPPGEHSPAARSLRGDAAPQPRTAGLSPKEGTGDLGRNV